MKFERQPMNNRFLWMIEIIQEIFAKTFFLPLDLLLTENRKDIEYRILFLDEVPTQKLYFYVLIILESQ